MKKRTIAQYHPDKMHSHLEKVLAFHMFIAQTEYGKYQDTNIYTF